MRGKHAFVGSLALSLGISLGASAAGGDPQEFTTQAATAGLYEVRAAEVARQKAQDADTRAFADQMINDHQKANQELRDLARRKSWTVPAALDAKHQQLVNRLGNLEGAAFDREYAQQQLQAHQEAVALFQEESERGRDPQLKSWAKEKLTTLRNHLEHARELGTPDEDRDRTAPDDGARR